jgi:AAA+ ATPase superfamily predicted ATPase
MRNPFSIREIGLDEPFCDRQKELKELTSHAVNRANLVLYSPRRYGKTSLVKRVQKEVKREGLVTVYADLFGIDSIEALAGRLVTCLYSFCRHEETLLNKAMKFITAWRPVIRPDADAGFSMTVEPTTTKSGIDLLEETFVLFGSFVKEHKAGFHIVLDEFQEITELKESRRIEGLMRSHIQGHKNVSYFFVGSRRRLLLDIFNEQKRPFYKSAINYALGPLPQTDAIAFILKEFARGGKKCPPHLAERIYNRVAGYPYYLQRIPYSIFELSTDEEVTEENYKKAMTDIVAEEEPYFQTKLEALSIHQKRLLHALSMEPTPSPFSLSYMKWHNLSSVGGTQGALNTLMLRDYVEKREDKHYYVVDPIFASYLDPAVKFCE